MTIGGNDIGFSEVAQSCITINPFSHPCKDKYKAGGKDQLAERIDGDGAESGGGAAGYPRPARRRRKSTSSTTRRSSPRPGSAAGRRCRSGSSDVPYLRSTEQKLNAMLATQAAANGATLVNWYGASIGHDACKSSSTRWVEPLVPGELAAPIHPNKAGMQGAANLVIAAAK